jgi:hypothetical protein
MNFQHDFYDIPDFKLHLSEEELGTEAIDFQINNKLGPELEALFQTVIDKRDNLVNNEGYKYNNALADKIYGFLKDSKFAEKFQNIVEKGLGFRLKKLKLIKGLDKGPTGCFYVMPVWTDISTEHGWETHIAWDEQYAGKENTFKNTSPHVIDDIVEFAEIAEGFDPKAGKFTKSTYGTDKKFIIIEMGFCVNTAFLSDIWTLKFAQDSKLATKYKDLGIDSNSKLTAKEITAIMLHECGHIATMLERSADFTHQFIRLNEILKYQVKYGDKTTILKDVSKNKERIKKLTNNVLKDKASIANKSLDLINNAGSVLTALSDTNNLTSTESWTEVTLAVENLFKVCKEVEEETGMEGIVDSIKGIFANVTEKKKNFIHGIAETGLLASCTFVYLYFMAIILLLGFYSTLTVLLAPGNTKYKTSDTNVNRRNWFQNEREADKFAIRQGYGPHLSEGLRKIYLISNNHTIYWSSSPFIQNSNVFNLIQNILNNIFPTLFLWGILENVIYENNILTGPIVRIDRTIEALMAAFKDPSIPEEMKDSYVDQIKKMKVSRDLFKSQHLKDAGSQNLSNLIVYLTFVPTTKFISMLVNGHVNQDYVKLQNQLDTFMNNEMFYQSHRLNKLLRS